MREEKDVNLRQAHMRWCPGDVYGNATGTIYGSVSAHAQLVFKYFEKITSTTK